MRLNRSVLYAVAALIKLAEHESDQPLSCPEICRRTSMPERFLLRIFRLLAHADIAEGIRGVGGGYRLAKPLHQISFLEIVEAVGVLPRFDIETLDGFSMDAQWTIGAAIAGVEEDVRKRLGAFTLNNLTTQNAADIALGALPSDHGALQ